MGKRVNIALAVLFITLMSVIVSQVLRSRLAHALGAMLLPSATMEEQPSSWKVCTALESGPL